MEPVTQGLLGAAVGQAGFSGRLGRRAMLWGALVGMLPDIDVLAAPLHGGFGEFVYHRGTTHSLWFGPVFGPLLGWLLWRWRDAERPESRSAWQWLCVVALVTHPLLDVFTAYGTQLFAPFWRERFAWNGVAIIDPLYSAILLVAVVIGARVACGPDRRQRVAWVALGISSVYLLAGVALNEVASGDARRILARDGTGPEVRAYPTLLQPFLRRIVARSEDRTWVGIHTSLALGCMTGSWFVHPPADPRVVDLVGTWRGRIFAWFAMEETSTRVEPVGGGRFVVSIEDLRYGGFDDSPDRGMWGVRALYDGAGRRVSPVVRFSRSIASRGTLAALWQAMWGEPPPSLGLPAATCG